MQAPIEEAMELFVQWAEANDRIYLGDLVKENLAAYLLEGKSPQEVVEALIETAPGIGKTPLIITYTNLLHKHRDPNAKEVKEFADKHKENQAFTRRVQTLNKLFALKESWQEKILNTPVDNTPKMMLSVDRKHGKSVELILDTTKDYYGDWIPGEGGDICLFRDRETKKVVGCHLPLYQEELLVLEDKPASKGLTAAREEMNAVDQGLTAYDFHDGNCVYVQHADGTEYRFNSAFAKLYRLDDVEYLWVFTEHNGCHAFSIGDLMENDGHPNFYSYKTEIITKIDYHSKSEVPPVRFTD